MSSGFGSIGGGGNTVVKRPHHQTHIFWDYESINPEQTPAAFVGTVLLTPVLLFRRIKEFLKEKQVAQGSVHGHVWVPSSSETVVGQLRDLQLQTTLLDNKLLIHRAMSAALASVMNTMPTNDTSIVVVTKDKAFVEQIKTLSDDGFSVFLVHDAQRGTALVDILETHATQAFHLSDIFASRDSSGGAQQQPPPPPLVVQNVAAGATPSSAATYHHLQQHHHHHIPPYHAPPPPLAAGSSPVVAPSAPLVVNNASSGVTIVIEGRRVPLEEVVRSEAVMSAVRSPNTAPVLRWCTSKQPHSPLECRFAHLAVSSNPNAAAVPGGAAAPPSAVSPALPPSYNQTVQSLGKSPAMTAPPPPAGVSPIMSFFSPPPPPPPPAGSAAAPPPPSSARFGLPAAVVPSPATRPNNMNSNVSGLQGRKSSAPAGVVHREDNSIGGPTRPFMNQSTDAMPPPAATTVSVWQDGTPSSNLEGGAALKSILHKLSTDSNPPFADDDDDGESLLSELRGVVLDALGERPTATLHQSGYGAAVEKGTAAPPKSVATGAAVAAVAPASSVPASGNEASSKPQKQSSLAAAVAALPSSHAEDDTSSGVDTRQKFPWGRLSQAQQPADHNNTVEDRDELPTLDSLKSEPSSTKKQTSKSSSSSMVGGGGGGGGSVTAPANSNKASFASIAKAHATAAATPSSPLSSANNKVAVAAPPAAKQKTVAGGPPTEYLIDGRHIPAQQLVRNKFVELYAATAGGIPHARFCTNTHAHNMMECTFAHRDVYPLLKGGEVEGSTLLNNKALENLRSNTSFKGNFCTSQKPHEAKTCTYLHKK